MQKLHKKFAFSTSEKDLTLTKFSTETSLSADYSSRTSNSFWKKSTNLYTRNLSDCL